ncbi:MAG: PEP-CTERM sorting domain-containing protein [Acidobacteriota bacterium]|nr:PEP-CTERM sorting domain-containing protein [Acidobacteriota bacterium]
MADCSSPSSPCGPTSANAIAELGGTIYATDYQNHLYRVNPATGAATLIGPTGLPALPITPGTSNPDGSVNFFDESLFNANGKLYATFDTGRGSQSGVTPVIPAHLYQIDPSTGQTTLIGPTTFSLNTAVDVSDTVYAFENMTSQVVTLNLANGDTTFFSNFDPSAGDLGGASPVPEPGSIALASIGIAAVVFWRRRVL